VFPPLQGGDATFRPKRIPIADPVVGARAGVHLAECRQNPAGVPEIVQHSGVSRRSPGDAVPGVCRRYVARRTANEPRLKRVRALFGRDKPLGAGHRNSLRFYQARVIWQGVRRTFRHDDAQYGAQRLR